MILSSEYGKKGFDSHTWTHEHTRSHIHTHTPALTYFSINSSTWNLPYTLYVSAFNEFIYALSVTARGTRAERAEYLFKLYDINGDEEITVDEFESILKLKVRTQEVQKMSEMFKEIDADDNGALTKDEFVEACRSNQKLMEYLDIY